MLKGAIARRYAAAIFDLARKQNTLDRTEEDMREMGKLFKHHKLAYLLHEPKIPAKRKETAIRQALTSKVLPTSLNLALLIVQRELVDLMPAIADEFAQLMLDYRNQAVAEVTTATQMDNAQLALVKQALEDQTGKGIIMNTHVNPSILGGVIARVGDSVIDGSVRYRLTALQQRLLTSGSNVQADLPEDMKDMGLDHHGTRPNDDYKTVSDAKPSAYRS
ncbi:MAG: ATP synthase F1 subunit delta [Chloroflexi bacterium]|nr:ATP synthase F1 subunit delta [Chloroflexota bacterium]